MVAHTLARVAYSWASHRIFLFLSFLMIIVNFVLVNKKKIISLYFSINRNHMCDTLNSKYNYFYYSFENRV